MRISDWSSDVCSSDLAAGAARRPARRHRLRQRDHLPAESRAGSGLARLLDGGDDQGGRAVLRADGRRDRRLGRSEEHTSELQSLMRISYAVFCLNKKNNNTAYNAKALLCTPSTHAEP